MFQQKAKNPVKGPFRGLLLNFYKNIDPEDFREVFSKITFEHPNFVYSENNKKRCIIYYNNPYDVATVLEAYKDNNSFYMSLFYDKLSRTLNPEVLFIKKPTTRVQNTIKLLKGKILTKNNFGCQIKFKKFKEAALAHEELRRETSVKFAYMSEVPKESRCIEQNDGNDQISDDVKKIFEKYSCYTPALRAEFKKTFEEMEENRPKINRAHYEEPQDLRSFLIERQELSNPVINNQTAIDITRSTNSVNNHQNMTNSQGASNSGRSNQEMTTKDPTTECKKRKFIREKYVFQSSGESSDGWEDIEKETLKTYKSMPNL